MLLRRDRRRAPASRPLSRPLSRSERELDADYAIVGAGCAGLSLAWHLVQRGVERTIVLVDPRTEYKRDRTWCFWDVERHPFEDAVTHRWSRWRVRVQGRWIERSAPGLRYEQLPSDAFYARVLARLASAPNVELRLGTRAGEIAEHPSHVECETSAGSLRTRAVFDSRPVPTHPIAEPGREITLLQHFEGWRVRTDRPVFDPAVATLMDFDVPQDHGVHFVYTLPYAPDEALVEATWFGAHVPGEHVYAESLRAYLHETLNARDFEVLDRERGVIPMTTRPLPLRSGQRTYRLGLPAGMAKPSTGYAFQAIQRYSARLSQRIENDTLPAPPDARPWRSRFQDRLFLSYLARYPGEGPALLARLFERVPAGVLVRFLSDVASPAEGFRVMREMPFAPMTTEVLRSPRLWL